MKRTFALAVACGLLVEPLFADAHGMFGRSMSGAPAFQGHFSAAPAASFAAPHSPGFHAAPHAAWTGRSVAGIAPSVPRNWDRRHDHDWDHHRFRWVGDSWVLIDPYSYGYPYFYSEGNFPDAADGLEPFGSEVQEALARQGYYRGDIDGSEGPMTRNAIAAYQRSHRLAVTGTINGQLLRSLGL